MRAEKSYSPLLQPTTNEDKLEVQVPRMWDFIFKTTKVSGKLGRLVILDGVTVPSEKARPLVGEPVTFAWRETMAPGVSAPKFAKILLPHVQPKNNSEAGPEDTIESLTTGISVETSVEDRDFP